MRPIRSPFFCLGLAVSMVGPVVASPTLDSASNSVSVSTGAGLNSIPCSSGLATDSLTVARNCKSASSGSTADAFASAGLGVIHASAQFNAGSSTITSGASAQAQATATDYLWLAGTPNTTARLMGTVVVSGGLLSQVSGSPLAANAAGSSYQLQGSFFGQSFSQSGSWTVGSNGYFDQSHPQGSNVPIDIAIRFDSTGYALGSFSMYVTASANGTANGYQETSTSAIISGSATAEASFGHTIYWGGIQSLSVDGMGEQAYTVQSASGLDYRVAAVPEPESWLMLIAGLGVVFRRSRRPPAK